MSHTAGIAGERQTPEAEQGKLEEGGAHVPPGGVLHRYGCWASSLPARSQAERPVEPARGAGSCGGTSGDMVA